MFDIVEKSLKLSWKHKILCLIAFFAIPSSTAAVVQSTVFKEMLEMKKTQDTILNEDEEYNYQKIEIPITKEESSGNTDIQRFGEIVNDVSDSVLGATTNREKDIPLYQSANKITVIVSIFMIALTIVMYIVTYWTKATLIDATYVGFIGTEVKLKPLLKNNKRKIWKLFLIDSIILTFIGTPIILLLIIPSFFVNQKAAVTAGFTTFAALIISATYWSIRGKYAARFFIINKLKPVEAIKATKNMGLKGKPLLLEVVNVLVMLAFGILTAINITTVINLVIGVVIGTFLSTYKEFTRTQLFLMAPVNQLNNPDNATPEN